MSKQSEAMVCQMRQSIHFRITDYTKRLADARASGSWTSLPYLEEVRSAMKNWEVQVISSTPMFTSRVTLENFLARIRSEMSEHDRDRDLFVEQEQYTRAVQSDARACACALMEKIMVEAMR